VAVVKEEWQSRVCSDYLQTMAGCKKKLGLSKAQCGSNKTEQLLIAVFVNKALTVRCG
jgi:hypothetical protein